MNRYKSIERIYIENVSPSRISNQNIDDSIKNVLLTLCYDNISNKKYIDIAGKIGEAIRILEGRI